MIGEPVHVVVKSQGHTANPCGVDRKALKFKGKIWQHHDVVSLPLSDKLSFTRHLV
jgi:hypothetical protein